jgi:signal transduction histidine kinase
VFIGAALWTVGLIAVLGVAFPLFFGKPHQRPHVVTIIRSPAIVLHSTTLVLVAAGCMIAGFVLVRGSLQPFDQMRSRLAGVRKGVERQLQGRYPAEVQPLVDDLNALLAHSERVVARATAKAGDLAHGLKTPLAVLSNEAERLSSRGDVELAAILAQQVSLMQRQVEYHLAHARAAASGTAVHARCSVAVTVDGLARTLLRLHAHRGLQIEATIDRDHAFRGRREDLDEMLGNILDNACKWAISRVTVSSSVHNGRISLVIDDDGPGLDSSIRDSVLQRGVRADEAVPGSGLGLAIVADLAELYEGSISLDRSPLSGLRVRLQLPAG